MLRRALFSALAAFGAIAFLQMPALAQEPATGCESGRCAGAGCAGARCAGTGIFGGCLKSPLFSRCCRESSPRMTFECCHPKPICNPCQLSNWGYTNTCWSPWPWAPDYSHCPTYGAPAAQTPPAPVMPPANGGSLPAGRKNGL